MSKQIRVTADVTLETKATKRHYQFVSARAEEEDDLVVISLANTSGQRLTVELPRAEIKRLFDWRMLLRL